MRRLLSELLDNIVQGTRLARFRPVDHGRLTVTVDQLVGLMVLDLALEIGSDWLLNRPDPDFTFWGLAYSSFALVFLLLGAFVATRLTRTAESLLPLLILYFATSPLLYLIHLLMEFGGRYTSEATADYFGYATMVLMGWMLLIPLRAFWETNGRRAERALVATLLLYAVVMPVLLFIDGNEGYWYPEEQPVVDPYAAYRGLDAESLLFAQPSMLDASLADIAPQRNGVTDIYFVSYASYAHQEVFRREVGYIHTLMAERFDTRDRAVSLINHLDDYRTLPLATPTNLDYTLQRLGEVINPEEDIVILYLTSHGSARHELASEFGDLPLNNLTPQRLREMFEAAGIQWRVVLVSSCYSGGYIAPMRDDFTLVATASSPDRQSFGCSNELDFTYFGEALFKGELSHNFSLVGAVESARTAIAERERRERLTPSQPQLFVGQAIETKLERLGRELEMSHCVAEAEAAGRSPLESC